MLRSMLDKGVSYLAAILLASMTILVFMGVVFRYWLHLPLDWGEEVSRYLFIWSAMLGAGVAMRRRAHFGIDAFVKGLSPAMRRDIALGVNLCICVLLSLVVVQGTKLTIINLTQISTTLGIPMAVPYAAIPVGALLMLICTISDAWAIVSQVERVER